jgi:hypothetical protein
MGEKGHTIEFIMVLIFKFYGGKIYNKEEKNGIF